MSRINLYRTAERAARRMERRGLVRIPGEVTCEGERLLREEKVPLYREHTAAIPSTFDVALGGGRMLRRGEPELVREWWSLPWVATASALFERARVGQSLERRLLLLRWFMEDPEFLTASLTTETMAREGGLDPEELLLELWFQHSMRGEVAVFPRHSYCYHGRAFTRRAASRAP